MHLSDCLQSAQVEEALQTGVRVTLEMGNEPQPWALPAGQLGAAQEVLPCKVVLPAEPRARTGVYWGYTVRIASGLSEVFSQCPFEVSPVPRAMPQDPTSLLNTTYYCAALKGQNDWHHIVSLAV